jgi:hypothetical protein
MIVRIEIEGSDLALYDYRVRYESEDLYADSGLSSPLEALVAAVEGLPPDAVGVEVCYRGVVSGTYPLGVVAMSPDQITEHALNTTAAIEEALG